MTQMFSLQRYDVLGVVGVMCWVWLSLSHRSLAAPPKPQQVAPNPGQHPYFSKHPKAWQRLVRLLRGTNQLKPVQPRRFPFGIQAYDPHKRRYDLAQHKGEYIFLTRWATWCHSCKYDLRAKRKLFRKLRGATYTILGVTHEPFALVARYQKQAPATKKFRYTLVDPSGRLAHFFRGMAYPTTTIIDPWGWIIADRVGPGLWVTPAYFKLFRYLNQLAPLAWKQLPTTPTACPPKRKPTH